MSKHSNVHNTCPVCSVKGKHMRCMALLRKVSGDDKRTGLASPREIRVAQQVIRQGW